MGLPANPIIPAVVLILSLLLVTPPPVSSAKLKTFSIRYDDFNNVNIGNLYFAPNYSTVAAGELHLTLETDASPSTNQSGRILYGKPFKLWEGRNDAYFDRVVSFNSSFLVNLNNKEGFPTAGFLVTPDLNLPPNSFGEYLGLTNFTTDGNISNQIVAIELDTFKQDFDPDSNHVGLNINSARSKTTTPLTPLGFELVGPNGTYNFFNVWVLYDGIKKFIAVYMAQQNQSDPTPPRPDTPILTSYWDLRRVTNQNSIFGFSASTGTSAELNRVLRRNLTVLEHRHKVKWLEIGLIVGILTVVLLPTSVLLIYCFIKRWLSRQSDQKMLDKVKSMLGMLRKYKYKDLEKATKNFDETMKLGQGAYGVVYKGLLEKDGEVAVKMFSRESLKGQDDFLAEFEIINLLRHKNLVKLRGWCHEQKKLLLVYDYMPNGSLDKHLYGGANSLPLSWDLRKKIIIGTAKALHYLHNEYDKRVVHRDVKASNIMLDAEFNAKLGDFGLARALDHEKTSFQDPEGVLGTRGYISLDYAYTGKATEQSDIYAFGAVLLEVVCGRRPGTRIGMHPLLVDWVWALHNDGQILDAVDSRLKEDNVAEEAQKLLLLGLACSHPTGSKRPKSQELVHMLLGKEPVPNVPPVKPHFESPLGPIGEDAISQATTNTTSYITITTDYGSGFAPMAINQEIHLSPIK